MNRINVLDSATSNKIAAGEVVERPFSVVKELVENSIDAKATNITIEIEEGGQKSIKVTDDGIGIHPEDIEKAFLPHGTSKIYTIEDIFKINTLGFRGEALASIASVSNTNLKSRTSEFEFGMEIDIGGGNVNYIKETGINKGTILEVNNLFYNVPARLKFLKSSQRETALISDITNRLALGNPGVSFRLFSNNKKHLTTYSTGDILDTIRAIYGKIICENIIAFEKHSDICSVHGYIGNSEISKGSRNTQSIFVNKRYIKSKLITAAVENAFKSFLTIHKFPFFLVYLEIYPELIDVNIHPTKSEIKFKDDREIFSLVFHAVHDALRVSLNSSFENSFKDEESRSFEYKKPFHEIIQLPIDSFTNEYTNNTLSNNNYSINEGTNNNKRYDNVSVEINLADSNSTSAENTKPVKTAKFSPLRIIGQYHNTYIIAEGEEGLFLIDQHAAHEKVLFEKFRNELIAQNVMSQILLTPIVIELMQEDYLSYVENRELFKNIGYNIDIFGDNTLNIREVPMLLGKPELKSLFMDTLENLKSMGSGEPTIVKYNMIASLACKAAIKAGNSLSEIEMKALLEGLRFLDDPYTCPHGRPTIIKTTLNELEKKFKRIQ